MVIVEMVCVSKSEKKKRKERFERREKVEGKKSRTVVIVGNS